MILIIKQKILTLDIQFHVFDNIDTKLYEIHSDPFTPDGRIEVIDAWDNLLGWVKWPMFGEDVTFSVGSTNAHMDKSSWQMQIDDGQFFSVEGDYYNSCFAVNGEGAETVAVVRYRATFSDSYVLELDEQAFPISYALLLVALIDQQYHSLGRRHPWP